MARVYASCGDVLHVLMQVQGPPLSGHSDLYGIPRVWWRAGLSQIDVWPLPREGCGLLLEDDDLGPPETYRAGLAEQRRVLR